MDIFSVDFARLLPGSITQDSAMQAAAAAVQRQISAVSAVVDQVAIWARLDALTEPLLSTLAWQLHVDDFEGWALAETDEQKRQLLRESLIIHRYKGTRWSLERMFSLLDMTGSVQEWFEYGGDPYKFMVELVLTRPTSQTFTSDMLSLIAALKNIRSHLDRLRIIPTITGETHTAAVAWGGVRSEIRPRPVTDLEASGVTRMAAVAWSSVAVELWPRPQLDEPPTWTNEPSAWASTANAWQPTAWEA